MIVSNITDPARYDKLYGERRLCYAGILDNRNDLEAFDAGMENYRMTEKSKRLKQLLKVIEDNEKNLTDTERMNYQNLKILHIGMQSKLYKIMLTWDFGWNALQKNQYTDLQESLDDDADFINRH